MKSLWEQVYEKVPLPDSQIVRSTSRLAGNQHRASGYNFLGGMKYQGYTLHWVSGYETTTCPEPNLHGRKVLSQRFVHITDLEVTADNVEAVSHCGRMRWKIENEGFNTLKNQGDALTHKWSRKSTQAMKNHYQLIQIAHIIVQWMAKSEAFVKKHLADQPNHPTLKSLWCELCVFLLCGVVDEAVIARQKVPKRTVQRLIA